MMYHLKFSLTGGASCSAGCSPPESCASGICSSTAMMSVPSSCICLALRKIVDQRGHAMADHRVHQEEISGKDEDRKNDNRGRRDDLSTGGRNPLAHLAAHIVEEGDPLARPCLEAL